MAMSPEAIRDLMKVERSPRDKGWKMTLEVTAYETGLLSVNGTPMRQKPHASEAMAEAHTTISQCLEEFCKVIQE